jgi:uncharacterized protein YlxW (UPF0749 family)
MSTRNFNLAVCGLAIALLAAPALAADKKKSQSDQAKSVINKQQEIASALRDKQQETPDALQKKLDGLKADLASEQSRHSSALAGLQGDLQTAQSSGNKKHAKNLQAAIDKENDAFNDRSTDLNNQITAVQAKLDAAKPK